MSKTKNLIGFLATIGLIFVALSFTVASPLNNGDEFFAESIVQVTDSVEINQDWNDSGSLDNLETNSDIIYAEANENGTFTTDVYEAEGLQELSISMVSDLRDGNIELTINMWEDQANGGPDESITLDVNETSYDRDLQEYEDEDGNTIDLRDYEEFEFEIYIEETAGSSNERPHVDSFEADFFRNDGDRALFFSRFLTMILILMSLIYIYYFASMKA